MPAEVLSVAICLFFDVESSKATTAIRTNRRKATSSRHLVTHSGIAQSHCAPLKQPPSHAEPLGSPDCFVGSRPDAWTSSHTMHTLRLMHMLVPPHQTDQRGA